MRTYKQLLKEQKKLDKEKVECLKCGEVCSWWELMEFGTCVDCYYKWEQNEDKGQETIKL